MVFVVSISEIPETQAYRSFYMQTFWVLLYGQATSGTWNSVFGWSRGWKVVSKRVGELKKVLFRVETSPVSIISLLSLEERTRLYRDTRRLAANWTLSQIYLSLSTPYLSFSVLVHYTIPDASFAGFHELKRSGLNRPGWAHVFKIPSASWDNEHIEVSYVSNKSVICYLNMVDWSWIYNSSGVRRTPLS